MEHIVQFGISIDDKAIQKRMEESAYDDVIKALTEDAKESFPKEYYRSPKIDWRAITNHVIEKFFDENKEKIIQIAANSLTEKLFRTKAVKEKTAEILSQV